MSDHYQSLGMPAALEKQRRRSRRSKYIVSRHNILVYALSNFLKVLGSIFGLLALIGIGVGVGVALSKNKRSSSSTSTGGSTNDPRVFTKDSRLHKSLYGVAYTPEGSLPDYGCSSTLGAYSTLISALLASYPTIENVIKDMQVRSFRP